MADSEHDNEGHEETGDVSNPVKVLRERVKQLEKTEVEKAQLERELAFVKAGVNLETKAGQYFARGYDGDMTPDAIRKELAELGVSGEAPPAKPDAEGESVDGGEAASTDERQRLATNSSNTPTTDNPRTVALNEAEALLAGGATREAAIGEAFGRLAVAGYQDKDPRVIYNPGGR